MKKALKKTDHALWHYVDGVRVEGAHGRIYGDMSEIYGDASGIRGDVSEISGDVTGIYGNTSNTSGNIDKCGLSHKDRKKGVHIIDLIG